MSTERPLVDYLAEAKTAAGQVHTDQATMYALVSIASDLRRIADQGEPQDRMMVIAKRAAQDVEIEELRAVLTTLVDPDDCSFDHNGDCQAHGFFGGPCGHDVAKELLGGQS